MFLTERSMQKGTSRARLESYHVEEFPVVFEGHHAALAVARYPRIDAILGDVRRKGRHARLQWSAHMEENAEVRQACWRAQRQVAAACVNADHLV